MSVVALMVSENFLFWMGFLWECGRTWLFYWWMMYGFGLVGWIFHEGSVDGDCVRNLGISELRVIAKRLYNIK